MAVLIVVHLYWQMAHKCIAYVLVVRKYFILVPLHGFINQLIVWLEAFKLWLLQWWLFSCNFISVLVLVFAIASWWIVVVSMSWDVNLCTVGGAKSATIVAVWWTGYSHVLHYSLLRPLKGLWLISWIIGSASDARSESTASILSHGVLSSLSDPISLLHNHQQDEVFADHHQKA